MYKCRFNVRHYINRTLYVLYLCYIHKGDEEEEEDEEKHLANEWQLIFEMYFTERGIGCYCVVRTVYVYYNLKYTKCNTYLYIEASSILHMEQIILLSTSEKLIVDSVIL